MTMVTVGYGDLTGTNNAEVLTSNITMYIACGVFAFSVNSIGNIIQNINKNYNENKKNIGLMNNFMKNNSINSSL